MNRSHMRNCRHTSQDDKLHHVILKQRDLTLSSIFFLHEDRLQVETNRRLNLSAGIIRTRFAAVSLLSIVKKRENVSWFHNTPATGCGSAELSRVPLCPGRCQVIDTQRPFWRGQEDIPGGVLERARKEEARKWEMRTVGVGRSDRKWKSDDSELSKSTRACCWRWGSDLRCNALQFPLLLEVRHVNRASLRVSKLLRTFVWFNEPSSNSAFRPAWFFVPPMWIIYFKSRHKKRLNSGWDLWEVFCWEGRNGIPARKPFLLSCCLSIPWTTFLLCPTTYIWDWTFVEAHSRERWDRVLGGCFAFKP